MASGRSRCPGTYLKFLHYPRACPPGLPYAPGATPRTSSGVILKMLRCLSLHSETARSMRIASRKGRGVIKNRGLFFFGILGVLAGVNSEGAYEGGY